jgi:hypothetical protein
MSYESQAALVGDEPYRKRVRAALLEEATTAETPGWDVVYQTIFQYTEKAVNRFAPLHAAAYDSGVATGLAVPSDNITDLDILSAVQTYWVEIVGPPSGPLAAM